MATQQNFTEDEVGVVPPMAGDDNAQGSYIPFGNNAPPGPDYARYESQIPAKAEGYKPYKKKAQPPPTSSFDEEQIRPSAALYQTHEKNRNQNQNTSSGYSRQTERKQFRIPSYPREELIGPQMKPTENDDVPQEDHSIDNINNPGVLGYKRRTFTVEDSLARKKQKGSTASQASAVSITNTTVSSIREKLAGGGKISKRQAKILDRDPDIVASIAMPTFVSHRVGSGLTPEQIKKAQDEHTRKLLGWKYHVASKAQEERLLNTRRQQQKDG